MKLNNGSKASVQVKLHGVESKEFAVNVGVHKGSVLSLLPIYCNI